MVVDAVKLPVEIPECELASVDVDGAALTGRDAGDFSDGNEFAHDLVEPGAASADGFSADAGAVGGLFFHGMSRA